VGRDTTRKQCNQCRNLVAEAKAKAEEFGGLVEQSPGPPRPVEADTSKKVADSVLFQLWFFSFSFSYSCYLCYLSVTVSVIVVIFQLQFTVYSYCFSVSISISVSYFA